MANSRQALLDYCAQDVALASGKPPMKVHDLGLWFVLRWIDPTYHEHGGPIAEFEREREFPHAGAAIAWARRQIFHGKVFGDAIEMETYYRTEFRGKIENHPHEVVDITLAGFCKWGRDNLGWSGPPGSTTLGKPERKCRIEV